MSPWYQAKPKGAVGNWISKKSNSEFGGSPETSTSIRSTAPSDTTLTPACAFGVHVAAPAETTMSKSLWGFFSGWASAVPGLANPARAIVPTTTVSSFIQFVRFMRFLLSVLFLASDSFVDGIRIHEAEVSLCDPGLTHLGGGRNFHEAISYLSGTSW